MSEIAVLKQINDVAFKQKVLIKFLNSEAIILLKDKFDRHLPLKAIRLEQHTLYCKGAVKLNLDFSYSETYTAHFKVDNEKYLIETTPKVENGQVVLDIKRVYHLQLRKTVRYKVPHNTEIKLLIGSHNEQSCLVHSAVTDLNSLGCSVVLNSTTTTFQAGDLIDAVLINGTESSVQLQGIIRNVRQHGPEQSAVGVEFHHMLYCAEDKLISMISELHSKTHLKSS
ncbi:MAG: PilZ domain-containing protein [Bdellovibrionota bacterium]